jgi:hypothetical protein
MNYITLVKKFLITADVQERAEILRKQANIEHHKAETSIDSLSKQLHITLDPEQTIAPVLLTENVTSDIELFDSYAGTDANTVFSHLSSNLHTTGAGIFLKSVLAHPTSDTYTLLQRQLVLKSISPKITPDIRRALTTLTEKESDINWLFQMSEDADNQNLHDLYDMVYFRFCLLKPFNAIPGAITGVNIYKIFASPAIGILSPLAYFIIPYMIFRMKFGFKIPFTTYMRFMFSTLIQGDMMTSVLLGTGGANIASKAVKWLSFLFSMLFYFQGMFNSVDVARTTYKIASFLTNKANSIIDAVRAADTLIKELWSPDIERVFSLDASPATATYISSVLAKEYKPFSVTTNFGQSLAFLKSINYQAILNCIRKAYVLDALVGTVLFSHDHTAVCYASYLTQPDKHLELADAWHICLRNRAPVANSIALSEDANMILTGPNAGGKSTFIKTVLVNIILAQTLGICCSSAALITPFDVIHTQINIPDCKGKESLFEAEMYRCKRTLDICSTNPEKRKLIVMDEIFNSTNPVEGIAGAYAVASKISTDPRALLMFTTHFIYLTKLSKTGRFQNYHMNVIKTDDDIQFPYKLSKGFSRQHVALELLRKNGFDKELVEDAIKIKNKLTAAASETDK